MVILLLALLSSSWCFASGERFEFYNGIRQMGMGGCSVATANDETALLSNPAGLGKLRDYFITVADPELDVGSNTEKIAKLDALKMTDPQACLLYTSPSPRDRQKSRMPSSA